MFVFTDGSTINNGKKDARGGIGIFIPPQKLTDEKQTETIQISYAIVPTEKIKVTNQICELLATILAIEQTANIYERLSIKNIITIYTDSLYVINSATEWCKKWIQNGWKNSSKAEIDNLWLIYRLVQLTQKHGVIYHHINSHMNEPDEKTSMAHFLWQGNFIADKLATNGSSAITITNKGMCVSPTNKTRSINWEKLCFLLFREIITDKNVISGEMPESVKRFYMDILGSKVQLKSEQLNNNVPTDGMQTDL